MSNEYRKENLKKGKINVVTILLLITVVVCVSVIVYLVFFKETTQKEYAPGVNDKNIVKIDDESKNSTSTVQMIYSKEATLNLETKKININFKNPKGSTQMIVIKIMANIDGNYLEIGNTDRIPAGYGINEVDMNEDILVKKGEYEGYFSLNYYENETEELASVNTKIPIKIVVE